MTSSNPGRAASGRRILPLLLPGPGPTALLTLTVVAATALPLAGPQYISRFVDDAIRGVNIDRLIPLALAYLALVVGGHTARMATAWVAGRVAWDGTNRLRERLTEHALGLDLAFHGGHTSGEMIERVDGDVVAVADFMVAFLLDVVVSVLLLCGVIVVVLTVHPGIGLILLGYCVLAGIGMVRVQRHAVHLAKRSRAADAAVFGYLEERLAGAEDLRANGAGEHAVRRFHQASATLWRTEVREDLVGSAILAGTLVTFAAGTALMLALAGTISVGTAVLLFQYMLMVRTPFERLIDQLRQYQAALAGIERIGDLLAEKPTLTTPATAVHLPATGPLRMEFDAVDFAYDDEPVLKSVTLDLAPGEVLGLVGRTGSGKTTIARLMARLYDPTAGVVRIGGLDLRQVDPASIRARIGVVTQDVQLFTAGVRENLTLFRPYPDDARLRAVLAEVGLTGWNLEAPLGTVSAGQAQLLALARVFLTDPGLVILDEASSRLDPATEHAIDQSVTRLLHGRTGILIAHRLTSLSHADQIAVVANGEIIEYGRRRDLLADPTSHFARMFAGATR